MKKNKNDQDLSNLFSEFEKIDLTGKELDEELISLGFDPKDLVKKVRERINKISADGLRTESAQEKIEELDPFLLAAGSKRRRKGARGEGKE